MHRAFGNARFLNKITKKSVLEVMVPLTQYLSRLNTRNSAFKKLSFVRRSTSVQVCPSIADYFSLHLLTFRRNVYLHAAQNVSPLKRPGNKKLLQTNSLFTRRLRILATSALLLSCLLAYLCAFICTVPN
jgi:hypothetical protein